MGSTPQTENGVNAGHLTSQALSSVVLYYGAPLRIKFERAIYHVTGRSNWRQKNSRDDKNRVLTRELPLSNKKRGNAKCLALTPSSSTFTGNSNGTFKGEIKRGQPLIFLQMESGNNGAYVMETEVEKRLPVRSFQPICSPSCALRCPVNETIEAMVLKALKKDSNLRYESAVALGEDIERYLAGTPTAELRRISRLASSDHHYNCFCSI